MNSKVDNSITSMNKNFTELARNQKRKPELVATFKNKDLNGATIPIKQTGEINTFRITNIGDATARNIRVFLYTNHSSCISFGPEVIFGPEVGLYNQEKDDDFSERFAGHFIANLGDLDPKEPKSIVIGINECENKIIADTLALIIRCGEQNPKKYEFIVQIQH